ncbi:MULTISPECIES: hypothetical protein [Vibrio]|uniref:hypothetical protein n=1 Tax=Vibrio TaxID=662 RepID=UPI0012D9AF04|nr:MULTISPECIES: hypothetical protein [Vibrio]
MMDKAWNWVSENFDVLFSGLGVYVISLFVAVMGYFFFRSKTSSNNVKMSNIRAGGDVVGRDKKG